MSRSSVDYDFRHAVKPCGEEGTLTQEPQPKGPCVYLTAGCPWYRMCDLPQKNPSAEPTRPIRGKMLC